MLIGQVYLKGNHLKLRDVDGSEVSMPAQDALDLMVWLKEHERELIDRAEQALLEGAESRGWPVDEEDSHTCMEVLHDE